MTGAVSLHSRLREATRTLHDDLERAVDIDYQISSRARYIAYLMRLRAIYLAVEIALDPIDFKPLGFECGNRRRSELIASDLKTLVGEPVSLRDEISLEPHRINTIEAGLGSMYVLEGSALGARAIAPLVEERLGLTRTLGAKFFWGYGEAGKPAWRAFLAAIDAIEPYSVQAEQVIESAEQTFLFFRRWLPECSEGRTFTTVA